MFINYTNHPSDAWGEKQRAEASKYGEILDIHFPDISPQMTVHEMNEFVKGETEKIIALVKSDDPSAVLCQGESGFTYMLVNSLLNKKLSAHRWESGLRNLKVVSAVSERKVIEIIEGDVTQKKSEFCFEGFREYSNGRNIVDTSNLQPSLYEKGVLNTRLITNDKILITQLGKGGYQNTNYVNKNGKFIASTGYVFDAVVKEVNPNKLLLIGTKTSGWAELLEWYSLHMPKEKKAQADKLGKQIVDQRGESIDWSEVENFIKEAAHFENVRVAIVEPGSTQTQLEEYPKTLLNAFKSISDQKRNTEIVFDISNGFRSMPLYITMFVRYAGLINRSEIEYSMYYGMYEASTNQGTPLVDLSAVSELTDWVNAISEFQSLGSVKGLCECLNREVGKQSDQEMQKQIKYVIRQFEQFDYAWNVNNPYYLENGIQYIIALDVESLPISAPAKLMLGSLRDEFSHRFEKEEIYSNTWLLVKLSELFTEQGRYGVAAVAFQEAVITYLMERYVKGYLMDTLDLSEDAYGKYLQEYNNRKPVKDHWDRKVNATKESSNQSRMEIFMEYYLKIKDNIRNVESHMIRREKIPKLADIKKWLTESQRLLREDMKCLAIGNGSLGFAELFSDFTVDKKATDEKAVSDFFKGKEKGEWNLLDETCPEHEKAIQTALKNANISLEKIQELRKQLLFIQRKCNAGSDLSLIDLKSVSMVKRLIQLWVESDFQASKTNRKVSEADLLNYMKTKTNAKGIRRNGFERLENALRNGQTGLLIEVLKK